MSDPDPMAGAHASGILAPPRVIETERLLIRPLEPSDLESCHQLFIDIGWDMEDLDDDENRERRRSWLDWTIAGYREFPRLAQPTNGERAIVRRADGAFIGLVGLVWSLGPFAQLPSLGGRKGARFSPEFGLFWALSPGAQGKGLATEAARAFLGHVTDLLNLSRVVATTRYDNVRSIGVMRRLGMRIETNPYPEMGPEWFQVVGVFEPGEAETWRP